MAKAKTGVSSAGNTIHYSVGAVIRKGDRYLIIERKKFPPGFACVAGHIDEGENPEESVIREVNEESGLNVSSLNLLTEEYISWNKCGDGVKGHHWYVFECKTSGEIKQNVSETKSIGWYSKPELANLKLEEVWEYWFKKLNII